MSKTIDIKEAVSEGRRVKFQYYKNKELWYSTESGETFPVPIEDIGEATFFHTDKAVLFMRYMRKWNDKLKNQ